MTTYVGLYYPFIHFKDDAWIKLAALYWDKMGRIVPNHYSTHDSDTVLALRSELGFIENFNPADASRSVGKRFYRLLANHEKALLKKYDVDNSDTWPDDLVTTTAAPAGSDPKFAYIYAEEKMWLDLRDALIMTRLAIPARNGDKRWIGLHPKLANVYMAALAEEMANDWGFHPVTDETINHVAVSGYSLERIAQALLGDVTLIRKKPRKYELESHVASIAIRSVIPVDIENIEVSKIILARKKYGTELSHFQDYIHTIAENLSNLQGIENEEALKFHLDMEYQKNLEPQLNDLKKALKSIGIGTIYSAMNLEVKDVGLTPILLALLNPVIALTGAIALSMLPVLKDGREARQETLMGSPVSYLLHLEQNLEPQTLNSWVRQRTQQFLYGS
jgi:hypothetical protein